MKNDELLITVGGATSSPVSIINALVRMGVFLYDTGRAFGSAIRYSVTGKKC